jgi:lycopene beta-cyclase
MQHELLILGGGCAGLSLARRLAAIGQRSPETLLLEKRASYTNDRTWCFWSEPTAELNHLVHHRWANISVSTDIDKEVVDCRPFTYAMIPSLAFYDESVEKVAQSTKIKLDLGVSVHSTPQKLGNLWFVETSTGTHSARMVVDTRPTEVPNHKESLLWQSFLGHEIECSVPVFDPSIAELMHFATVREGRILFFYLLPTSTNRALLEVTVFAEEALAPESLKKELSDFIDRRVQGLSYTVQRTENGILPMNPGFLSPQIDPTYVKAGLFSGGARPSSGYAFQRIQRWAETCAQALGAGKPPTMHPMDPMALRMMDGLFLRVLNRYPELAPNIFLALFQKVNIARIVRFMSDQATLSDCAVIASALPPMPFIREIFSARRGAKYP